MPSVNDEDRKIVLSLEKEIETPDWSSLPGWDGYSVPAGTDTSRAPTVRVPVALTIDSDGDSSQTPSEWILFMFSDEDENWFMLTYEEAAQVRNRLNILLENYDKL